MSSYISNSHCKFYLKIHLIFVCKYRKKLLETKDGLYFLNNNKINNRYKIKCELYYGD